MKTMLIVDDDRGSRESLRQTFSRLYQTRLAENAAEAHRTLNEHPVDIVMLDVMMPEKDGVTLLKELNDLHPGLPCVMVSASLAVRPVVEAMKAGACDFVVKPFDVEEIRRIVARVIETNALRRRIEVLQDEVAREYPIDELVGQAPAFLETLKAVQQASASDATVLIQGESGTGKELIARRLHRLSPRADEPFVPIHCSALPETLMESELFGHEKGAFTGADTRKMGRFDLAGSGTLFFDEVGEMSLAMQVKLLRVLQEREYMRLGGTQVIKTHARNHTVGDFSPDALEKLAAYSWPGNIRELRNIIERTLVLHGKQELIRGEHLPEFIQSKPVVPVHAKLETSNLESAVANYERDLIVNALRDSKGIQTRAARLLGTTRRILRYKMDKLSIRAAEIREE